MNEGSPSPPANAKILTILLQELQLPPFIIPHQIHPILCIIQHLPVFPLILIHPHRGVIRRDDTRTRPQHADDGGILPRQRGDGVDDGREGEGAVGGEAGVVCVDEGDGVVVCVAVELGGYYVGVGGEEVDVGGVAGWVVD